jgi:adenylate cyclase class 2
MYEVEVKAHLRNRKEVIKKLEDFGCKFSEELHQVDSIFIPEGKPFPEPLGTPALRIRRENDKILFTLKITQTGRQDCIERELEIKDGDKMIEIVKLLKFYEIPSVDKKRIKTHVKDIEVAIDTVKDLGEFIEAERIVTHVDPEERKKIQEELFDFLGTIGIKKEDRVIDGKYPMMLWEKFNSK